MTEWTEGDGVADVERVLMLRAVARFSDECEAPELTPECPFYEVGHSGPVCAEQCQDLIAKFPDDLVRPDALGLGVGLTARRSRRPRRGPSPDARAFDAAEIRLEDRGRPLDEQRLTALLATLSAVASGDPATRNVDVEALLNEVEHRGVDVDTVVRLGLSEAFLRNVTLALWSTSPGVGLPERLVRSLQALGEQWRVTLEDFGGLSDHGVGARLNTAGTAAVRDWFLRTSPAESLTGAIPTADDLRSDPGAPEAIESTEELVGDAEWLFDRFTKTYPAEWREGSLVREWRYLNTQRIGCCPPGLMRQRMVDEVDVARALADERCSREEAETAEPPWRQLKRHAVTAAVEGRLELAADIFGVVAELDPQDTEVMNNLGFCRLPSSPSEAIGALERARAQTSTPILTDLNLSLAMHLHGDERAIDVALGALHEELNEAPHAYVWRLTDGELALELIDDLISYGEELVAHMADCEGRCASLTVDAP